MAEKDKQQDLEKKRKELETFRTEYRTLIGRAIVSGLLTPHAGGVGGFGGIGGSFFLKGPDYDQDSGDYTQSGGGSHEQNSGSYTQSP